MIYVLVPWVAYEGFSRPVRAFSTEEAARVAFDETAPEDKHVGFTIVAVPLDDEDAEVRGVADKCGPRDLVGEWLKSVRGA